jgi:Predicted hydrolase (metallo-beta-lactamase superfamily)
VLDYLEAIGVEHIDHLVATHAHADHIGGHAEVIEQFETEHDGIGFVYDSGVSHTTQTYED